MKRNRIVINFDKLRSGYGKKARGGLARPLIIIAVVLLLLVGGVAGGGYLWWRRYQGTPAYSLAVLADAAQRNDQATVDSILDMDKVTEDFVSQVRQLTTGSASSLLPSDWSAKVNSLVPSVTPKLKETVHDELVKELKRLTEPAAGKPFILIALAITGFADIKEENNVAHAVVNIKDEQLRLTMQPEAGHWRITAVQDDKLVKLIGDSVIRNLPTTTAPLQDEIHKQLDKLKKPAR
jgi:hypothetical protein